MVAHIHRIVAIQQHFVNDIFPVASKARAALDTIVVFAAATIAVAHLLCLSGVDTWPRLDDPLARGVVSLIPVAWL
jgi:hypothetical protein